MDARMLLIPDSTARLILRELDTSARLTQDQLVGRTGRTKGSISKAIKFLVTEGYVRQTGTRANRFGQLGGKPTQEFSRTAKVLAPDEGKLRVDPLTLRELAGIMFDLVSGSLAARRVYEPDGANLHGLR